MYHFFMSWPGNSDIKQTGWISDVDNGNLSLDHQPRPIDQQWVSADGQFQQLKDWTKQNPELQNILELFKKYIISSIKNEPNKIHDLSNSLKNPSAYITNPALYSTLFQFLEPKVGQKTLELSEQEEESLDNTSKVVLGQYISYRTRRVKELKVVAQKGIETNKAMVSASKSGLEDGKKTLADGKKTLADGEETLADGEARKKNAMELESAVNRMLDVIPSKWKSGMEKFVGENQNNQKLISDTTRMRPALGLPREWESSVGKEVQIKNYLRAIYISEHQWEIRKDIQKLEKEAPEIEKQKYRDQLKLFDTGILSLNALNFPRPVKSLGSEMDRNFPPTRPAETARVQAEKLEKTHDIYRDGTSLYFVDRKNPENMKRMDIYADHVTMSIYRNWLSLSQELPMLTREETEQRKDIRKAEWESQERSRETDIVWGGFFRERGKEYEKIPWSTRNTIDVLKSRPVRWVQEQYEEYEQLLATKSTVELRKEWDSSKQSKWSIIGKMLELSRQLYVDNQQYFTLGTFWEEGALNEADHVKNQLDKRILWLNVFKKSIDMSESYWAEVNKLRQGFNPWGKIDTSKWEELAWSFLWELTGDRIWLNGLSDENFQDLLSRLKQRDIAGGIWKEGMSLGQDTVSRKNQRDELSSLSQLVGGREWWQRIAKQIRIDGTLANRAFKWENGQFEKWIQSLEKPKSDTP